MMHSKRHKQLTRSSFAALLAVGFLTAGRVDPSTAQTMHHDPAGDVIIDADSPLLPHLAVEAVKVEERPKTIDAPGEIAAEPARTISLLPPVAGHIVRLDVAPGTRVKRGQLLALIASGDMAQASSDEEKARAAYTLAGDQYERARHVVGAGGGAVKDLESARAAYAQARSELDRAHDRLAALGRDGQAGTDAHAGSLVPLAAPIDGVIDTVSVAAGMNVTDPTAVMMTLLDTRMLWVTADLAEDQAPLVQAGMTARATLPVLPGLHLGGTSDGRRPSLQADTRRRTVHFEVTNSTGTLLPHLYAHVAIAVPQPPDITIPQTAILMNNDATTVFVEVRPHVFRRRTVDIVYDDGTDSRVLSGLAAGDRVVTQGAVLLNDD